MTRHWRRPLLPPLRQVAAVVEAVWYTVSW